MHAIIRELAEVPWAEMTRLAVTIFLCWATWALTKHWYAKEWRRFAPEKAQEELKAAQGELRRDAVRIGQLQAYAAKLRGQVMAARNRLADPTLIEVVEARR